MPDPLGRSLEGFRRIVGRAVDARAWRPANGRLFAGQVFHRDRNREAGYSDRDHLEAAAAWLERAQDVSGDGGVCGRYLLGGGWTSSYPETTGYLVPTFLALAEALGAERFRDRARRAVEFLLRIQLPGGAFRGGEIHEERTEPSVFNTAQILHGLAAWHAASGDQRSLEAARCAADWLLSVQDADGAWRRHAYRDLPVAYSAHASCWLADFGRHVGESRYLDGAGLHLDWVLAHRDPETGWFDAAGFSTEDHAARVAVTHTIAYTLSGLLHAGVILKREDATSAVRQAAAAIARRLELAHRLSGVLDHRWRGRAGYVCLTGNAQMALVWLRLYGIDGEPGLLNAALEAIDAVKAAQPMASPDPAIRGGVPGSDPIWGGYLYLGLPNWAAKFFVDVLLAKRAVLAGLSTRPRLGRQPPSDVPRELPAPTGSGQARPRVVLYTRSDSDRALQMLDAWSAWGFRPDAVIVETPPEATLPTRLARRIRAEGLGWIPRRIAGRLVPAGRGAAPRPAVSAGHLATLCERRGIRVVRVGSLEDPASIAAVAALAPDLAVHAGAGILRPPLLAIPRLGTLNAHMGLLPYYRGMNVAEWARFNGDAVGCSVHLVDGGIDTGDILCVRRLDADSARSIAQLRRLVDEAQVSVLGEVLRWVLETGRLPPRRSQTAGEGVQRFRMHPELGAQLERELAASA